LPIPEEVRAAFLRVRNRIQGLEDESDIENLQRIFGFYVDKQLWKEAADLFADEGTLEVGGQGVFAGKSRVLEYFDRISPAGLTRGKLFNHIQLQPIIDLAPDGKSAKGRWRFLSELGEYKKSAAWCGGTSENEYVKENGVWKFKSLHFFVTYYIDYDKGWDKGGNAPPAPIKGFPPDQPPSVDFKTFPDLFIPPYHYKNPVTGR
jgi:hypothetical protein